MNSPTKQISTERKAWIILKTPKGKARAFVNFPPNTKKMEIEIYTPTKAYCEYKRKQDASRAAIKKRMQLPEYMKLQDIMRPIDKLFADFIKAGLMDPDLDDIPYVVTPIIDWSTAKFN